MEIQQSRNTTSTPGSEGPFEAESHSLELTDKAGSSFLRNRSGAGLNSPVQREQRQAPAHPLRQRDAAAEEPAGQEGKVMCWGGTASLPLPGLPGHRQPHGETRTRWSLLNVTGQTFFPAAGSCRPLLCDHAGFQGRRCHGAPASRESVYRHPAACGSKGHLN